MSGDPDIPSWRANPLVDRLDAAGVTRPVSTREVPMPDPPSKSFPERKPISSDTVGAMFLLVLFLALYVPLVIALWRWALTS